MSHSKPFVTQLRWPVRYGGCWLTPESLVCAVAAPKPANRFARRRYLLREAARRWYATCASRPGSGRAGNQLGAHHREASRFLANWRTSPRQAVLFVAFAFPYSPAVGVKLIATP